MQSTHFNLFRGSLPSFDQVAADVVNTLKAIDGTETQDLPALYEFVYNAATSVNQKDENSLGWIRSNAQSMAPLLEQASRAYMRDRIAGGPSEMLANIATRTRYAAKHLIIGILRC